MESCWTRKCNAVLYNRVLIEDDGPGQGSDADWLKTDGVATEKISGDVRVKKILHIDRLGAMDARLIVPTGVGIEINGNVVEPATGGPNSIPGLQVSPSLLKEGDNVVILSNVNGKSETVKIASTEDILRNAPERKLSVAAASQFQKHRRRQILGTDSRRIFCPTAPDAIRPARRHYIAGDRPGRRFGGSSAAADAGNN